MQFSTAHLQQGRAAEQAVARLRGGLPGIPVECTARSHRLASAHVIPGFSIEWKVSLGNSKLTNTLARPGTIQYTRANTMPVTASGIRDRQTSGRQLPASGTVGT